MPLDDDFGVLVMRRFGGPLDQRWRLRVNFCTKRIVLSEFFLVCLVLVVCSV